MEEGEIIRWTRRTPSWFGNPVYDFHNKYTTSSGAVAFTKQDYKTIMVTFGNIIGMIQQFGKNIFQFFMVVWLWIQYNWTVLSTDLQQWTSYHSIKEKIMKIEDIYYDNEENKHNLYSPLCEIETHQISYFVAMKLDFINLNMMDFYTIKNYLLDIEFMWNY